MQVVVVISMSDLLDDSCKGHAEKVYESNAVAQAVAQIHHVTGLPPNTIFPLVNYFWNDTGKSMIIEKMVAMILIRVLEQADGMFLRRFNQQRLGYVLLQYLGAVRSLYMDCQICERTKSLFHF
jgi:hypothetical protein